jgi:hypothetical protein
MLPDTAVVGMTGKFHRSWGEFGGFKDPLALRYEAAQIMSLGCMACVGDQLHPRGRMDEETYRIVGEAYQDIEKREPWLLGCTPVADVAVLSPAAVRKEAVHLNLPETGACRMLMECHIPHVVLDDTMDFTPYRLLLLPDDVPVADGLAAKLSAYMARGGKLLLTGSSGLNPARTAFAVDTGIDFAGFSPWDVEYIEVLDKLAPGMVMSPFLAYDTGVQLQPREAETLAHTWHPYFNRTYARFCSHQNTPHDQRSPYPAAAAGHSAIHIAQPLFRAYAEQGMKLHRQLVRNCIRLLLDGDLMLETDLPSCGRVSIMRQEKQARTIVHLLYANPIRRGRTEVIEDVVPVHDVHFSLKTGRAPGGASLAPSGKPVATRCEDGRLHVVVPRLWMHEMVVIQDGTDGRCV